MNNDKMKHGSDNQQSPSKSGIKPGETRKDQFQQGGKQAGQPLRQGQDQKSDKDRSDKQR